MNFINFEVGEKTYKLRLNTRNTVLLEKQLGCNPLSIFGDGEQIPTITAMVAVFHAAAQQYQHGISLNDAYDIFDEFLEEHAATEFIPTILELYKVSGLVPRDKKDNEEKNV